MKKKQTAPKIEVKTTTPMHIKQIALQTARLKEAHERMTAMVARLIEVHENREAILAAAYEEGIPGDPTRFNAAVFGIKEEATFLRQLATGFDNYADSLLSEPVTEWK